MVKYNGIQIYDCECVVRSSLVQEVRTENGQVQQHWGSGCASSVWPVEGVQNTVESDFTAKTFKTKIFALFSSTNF